MLELVRRKMAQAEDRVAEVEAQLEKVKAARDRREACIDQALSLINDTERLLKEKKPSPSPFALLDMYRAALRGDGDKDGGRDE